MKQSESSERQDATVWHDKPIEAALHQVDDTEPGSADSSAAVAQPSEAVLPEIPQLEKNPEVFARILSIIKNDGWDNMYPRIKTDHLKKVLDMLFDGGMFSGYVNSV